MIYGFHVVASHCYIFSSTNRTLDSSKNRDEYEGLSVSDLEFKKDFVFSSKLGVFRNPFKRQKTLQFGKAKPSPMLSVRSSRFTIHAVSPSPTS